MSPAARAPAITISDERGALLETGGGVKKALPLLGARPVLPVNSDSLWIEGPAAEPPRAWSRLGSGRAWTSCCSLAATRDSLGYDGRGDFVHGRGRAACSGAASARCAPFVYAGVAI